MEKLAFWKARSTYLVSGGVALLVFGGYITPEAAEATEMTAMTTLNILASSIDEIVGAFAVVGGWFERTNPKKSLTL